MSDHHHHANVESDLHRAFLLDDDGINDIVDFNEQHDTPRWKHDHRDLHHHHGPNSDILIHEHEGRTHHHHPVTVYFVVGADHDIYASADHNHDDDLPPSTDDGTSTIFITPDDPDPARTANDFLSWADDIDNVTGGNPYNHRP